MGPRLFSRGNRGNGLAEAGQQHASMGPRLFSRGNEERDGFKADRRRRLQWGHDFSAVEISRIGAADICMLTASMGPRLFSRGNPSAYSIMPSGSFCFNGATTFQPWKCLGTVLQILLSERASMGPRLFSRGNEWVDLHIRIPASLCFNGATTFQPWKWENTAVAR